MIVIQSLAKSFGARRVLDGVDARVGAGDVVAIAGPSGCGKTTLLRCLNGLERFDEGKIEIGGFELRPGKTAPETLRRLRCAVGIVFQDFQLFPHLSVLENVTLAPRLVRGVAPDVAERAGRAWLERVGLGDRGAARPSELSGGQKQRVAIARALAQGVRVLLLDEPTSALDPEMREEVREVLREVAAKGGEDGAPLTLVLVTHEMRLATELSSALWVMNRGAIVERGAPRDVLERPESDVARDFLARERRKFEAERPLPERS
jgi:ABC-type polar amino acid transport system ATPase subunit